MVGHRLPKKVDNRSQAEKDKERDYLISQCQDKDLIERLELGQITSQRLINQLAVIAVNIRSTHCCNVDGYRINRFEAETLCTFFFYLNQKDLVRCGLDVVVDFITSNYRTKQKVYGYLKGLIDQDYLRAADKFGNGIRYEVTDQGYNFITRYLYYSTNFADQSNDNRIEVFLSRIRVNLKKMIRAKPRKKGKPLPGRVEAIAA